MNTNGAIVGILMGSQSDWNTMRNAFVTLNKLGIPCEANVISAHRHPDRLAEYVKSAKDRGLKVLIAGAGMAAALPGAVAAMTPLPVLGVPIETRCMGGIDSLLSMVQMPRGVPVATLAIGNSGAVNAALMAASILALGDAKIAAALDHFRAEQSANVPHLETEN
ncbi:MAG: 5-(carboxyamino)imidazole ribonucleotide mutase [Rhodospirillales bacterium]|jgi:5-(carboxyamino)imidazole ribonucleotide mutase|nr:5-(carboxyamino)imidazole ribonucleotide mutase [Rhodospirillales bacterium]